jgi:hypothetical protein
MGERKVGLLLRIPEGLKRRIVELAKREHRSVNQQIEFLLERSLSKDLLSSGLEKGSGVGEKHTQK